MSRQRSPIKKTLSTALIGISAAGASTMYPSFASAQPDGSRWQDPPAIRADFVRGDSYFGGLPQASITQRLLDPRETLTLADLSDMDAQIAADSFSSLLSRGASGDGVQDSLASHVTVLPEAEGWALMLVGTALVGFQLRRKSKQLSAHRVVQSDRRA